MELLLDMKTIFITLTVGHFFTVILISAYWRDHQKDNKLNIFFLAKIVQAVAWFFLTLRGGIPDAFTISFSNSLLFIGSSLETIAILKLLDTFSAFYKKVYLYLTVFNIVGFHLLLIFYNMESVRIAFASFGTALLVIIPAYQMFRLRTKSVLLKIMSCFYFLVIVSLIGRGIGALFHERMGLFTPGLNQTFAFLSLYLIMILGNMGFVLLLKERADKELIHMASYDDLTGALNRRTFISRAEQCMKASAKSKEPLSLLLFDVDHFKKINDTYGHIAGDRVLRNLAEQIKKQMSPNYLFGRYGGDEFAILLPNADECESNAFAERIRKQVGSKPSEDYMINYTLSMGLFTVIPDAATQLEDLYIPCDKAVYKAKNNGRDGVWR